jgi:hypothetical protein
MAKIIAKVKINRVEEWSTDWENYNELRKLKYDMKMAIFERCGVDFDNIEIEISLDD